VETLRGYAEFGRAERLQPTSMELFRQFTTLVGRRDNSWVSDQIMRELQSETYCPQSLRYVSYFSLFSLFSLLSPRSFNPSTLYHFFQGVKIRLYLLMGSLPSSRVLNPSVIIFTSFFKGLEASFRLLSRVPKPVCSCLLIVLIKFVCCYIFFVL